MEKDNFPYERFSNYTIFENEEEFQNINTSEHIYVNKTFVSREFIYRILNDSKYYAYALRYLQGKINNFKVVVIRNGDIASSISYAKKTIIMAIEKIINEEKLVEYQDKYDTLKECINLDKFIDKYQNTSYKLEIEGHEYSIKTNDLIDLLKLNNSVFRKMMDSDEKDICGIPKEYFIYAIKKFLEKEEIIDNYVLPVNVDDNIKDILNDYLDTYAINKLLDTKDTLYTKININQELEKAILKDMPVDLDSLEKALYIYVKMCLLLSYDEEFYALNEEGSVTLKHQDYHHVEEINLQNNNVVCYEFNLLYAKMLSKLKIHFASEYRGGVNESTYGMGHANLTFRVDKYIVSADSVNGIINGDMASSKTNKKFNGIDCLNKNKKTQKVFLEKFNKVLKLIYDKELEHKDSFGSLVKAYQEKTKNYKKVSFQDKVRIIITKINDKKLKGVDAFSYLLQLRKIIFNEDEREFMFKVNVVADSLAFDERKARLVAIISINEDEYWNKDATKFYVFIPGEDLKEIAFEELRECFKNCRFSYLEGDNNIIYGINKGVYCD